MLLQQLSASDPVTQAVVSAMLSRSTVLEFAEFYSIVGNADYARKAASANGGKFRALNTDYPANQVNPVFANPALKILGDKVEVDKAHERRGADVPSVRAMELNSFAQNLGRQFQNYFFNGDNGANSNAFNGLKIQLPTGQKITAGTNGLSVDMGNSDAAVKNQQNFLEQLDALIETVDGGAQALWMDGKVIARLSSIARGQVVWTKNEFGQQVATYNGIPIRPGGYDNAGNKVLPHTETVGTSTNCTSIYAVRFGERTDTTLASNVGVEVKDLGVVGVHYTHNVDFDVDLAILNDKSCARLEGIIIP